MKIYRAWIEIFDNIIDESTCHEYAYHLTYETAHVELNKKLASLKSLNLDCFTITGFGIKKIKVKK